MDLERIVVGVDGSACAVVAAEWAAMLARLSGAEVVAVHTLGLLEQLPDGERVAAEPRREEIQQQLDTVWTVPWRSGRALPGRCRDGDAVSVLLGAADDVDADLVVLGSRGMGGYPRAAARQHQHAGRPERHRPVLIIPAASAGP